MSYRILRNFLKYCTFIRCVWSFVTNYRNNFVDCKFRTKEDKGLKVLEVKKKDRSMFLIVSIPIKWISLAKLPTAFTSIEYH